MDRTIAVLVAALLVATFPAVARSSHLRDGILSRLGRDVATTIAPRATVTTSATATARQTVSAEGCAVGTSSEASCPPVEEREEDADPLEGELASLGGRRRSKEEPLLEEPVDVDDHPRHGPDVSVTTHVPTTLTEEETRVDEPTERGPTEPTQEHGASTVPSGTRTDPDDGEDGYPGTTASVDAPWEEERRTEQLVPVTTESSREGPAAEDESVETTTYSSSEETDVDGGAWIRNASDAVEAELPKRSVRRSNARGSEDLLELIVALAEQPNAWHKVSEMLGKMDYEASSKLKTILQLKAARDKHRKATVDRIRMNHAFPSENGIHKTPAAALPPKDTGLHPSHRWTPRPTRPSALHALRTNLSDARGGHRMTETPFHGLPDLYRGPINTIAIDVPGGHTQRVKIDNGKGKANNNNNKQAYIAVTVYKPTTNDFHKVVDLTSKSNKNKQHVPTRLPLHKAYAVEKPVTVVSPYNSVVAAHADENAVLKSGKPRVRVKGKGGQGGVDRNKPNKHPSKWKFKSKMDPDEMEAQLMAMSMMEKKLKQHLMQKERLRQRLRQHHNHHHHNTNTNGGGGGGGGTSYNNYKYKYDVDHDTLRHQHRLSPRDM